ncbi:outer membrane protein [Alteromonadaceae bacterium Bs31]|nr:outer membrane protein [Alteromonadaceae bacterium Bs31]
MSTLVRFFIVTVLCVLSATASADTIFGVYGGIGVWQADIDGSMGIDDVPITTNELGIDEQQSQVFYVAIEHPIPVVPNIRLQYTPLEYDGFAVVEREFTWDDITFPANAPTTTQLDLSHTDITLYYEILDNWVSFDLGLTAKMVDGSASVDSRPEGTDPITEQTELNGTLPMAYAMARFDLPLSGAYLGGHINYVSYDGSTLSDLDVKLGWQYESVLDVGFELGYRQFKIELQEFEDANADLSFDGPYLNLAVHF